MVKKSNVLFLGVTCLLGFLGCHKLPVISAEQASVPQFSIKVSSSDNVDAASWCQTGENKGIQKPFGFGKVQFYRDKSDPEKKEYIVGCITNNSQKTIEQLPVSYTVQFPPENSKFSGGISSLTLASPIQPGKTVYFRSDFEVDPDALGVEMSLQETKQKEQTITYEPIQRLVIQRSN
ncbi:hypothetical protein ACE1B6_26125 [Aerosakkonemataceae cyanobacterium BLCC-F154]|uniref:Lipoprotein n=1 Tax=Floridaenema fluviatile BLCC-F154 TaxID=3153640 RepID=A0ABV4YKJ5_9CYAN